MQYFLVVPDAANKDKALLEGIDYPAFFKLLSDKDVFSAILLLHKRESTNSFTDKLLTKELGVPQEKAKQIISELLRLHLLRKTVAEIDDELVEFYQFLARPSFVSMLIFAREMIDIPSNFYVHFDGRHKPYLK